MFIPIVDAKESMEAFEALKSQWCNGANRYVNRSVGFRGGAHQCDVFWRSEVNCWGVFEEAVVQGRFWICWGNVHPHKSFNIVAETNPPLSGVNRRCRGVFLKNENKIYLAHNGGVGGGRKGIGKSAFRGYSKLDEWVTVHWPDKRTTEYLVIGKIGASDFVPKTAEFITEVDQFKEWAVRNDANLN